MLYCQLWHSCDIVRVIWWLYIAILSIFFSINVGMVFFLLKELEYKLHCLRCRKSNFNIGFLIWSLTFFYFITFSFTFHNFLFGSYQTILGSNFMFSWNKWSEQNFVFLFLINTFIASQRIAFKFSQAPRQNLNFHSYFECK